MRGPRHATNRHSRRYGVDRADRARRGNVGRDDRLRRGVRAVVDQGWCAILVQRPMTGGDAYEPEIAALVRRRLE